jgi:phosphatidate cytidylyltransferase
VLKLRVLTVAILLPVFVLCLFYLPPTAWAAVMLVALLVGAQEWSLLAGFSAISAFSFYAILAALCIVAWWFPQADTAVFAASVVFWTFGVPALLWRKPKLAANTIAALTGIVVLLPMWLAMVRMQAMPALLLALLAIVWISDSAAYGAGRWLGRHKLAPAISPGKTWEGVGGAFVAVGVYAAIFHFCWYPATGFVYVLTAFLAIAVLGILGDLYESLLKRGAGVKDSGNCLPGHGGVLDRIDAITAGLPLAALLFARL